MDNWCGSASRFDDSGQGKPPRSDPQGTGPAWRARRLRGHRRSAAEADQRNTGRLEVVPDAGHSRQSHRQDAVELRYHAARDAACAHGAARDARARRWYRSVQLDKTQFPDARGRAQRRISSPSSLPNEWEAIERGPSASRPVRSGRSWSGLPGSENLTKTLRAQNWGTPGNKGKGDEVKAALAGGREDRSPPPTSSRTSRHAPIGAIHRRRRRAKRRHDHGVDAFVATRRACARGIAHHDGDRRPTRSSCAGSIMPASSGARHLAATARKRMR